MPRLVTTLLIIAALSAIADGCTAPAVVRFERPAVPGCLPVDLEGTLERERPLAAYACEGGASTGALRDRWLLSVTPDGRARGTYTYIGRLACVDRDRVLGREDLAALRSAVAALRARWPPSVPRASDDAQRCWLYASTPEGLVRVEFDDVPQPGVLGEVRAVLREIDRRLGAPVEIDTGLPPAFEDRE